MDIIKVYKFGNECRVIIQDENKQFYYWIFFIHPEDECRNIYDIVNDSNYDTDGFSCGSFRTLDECIADMQEA